MSHHPHYAHLIQLAERSHAENRNPAGIAENDVARARLYCYAFRRHTIGVFDATRRRLTADAAVVAAAQAWRTRAIEALTDLANLAMETVPTDFRVLIATLYRYHQGVDRVMDSLAREAQLTRDAQLDAVGRRFAEVVRDVTSCSGIELTQDTTAPAQASFIVPNLGITIVPLVYGDHHSWNLAYLAGEMRNVPTHRHRRGVEIHLGFDPTHGQTVMAGCRADVSEGYAMPIPPETDHGWVNTSDKAHHVPFIFGSRQYGGWGVFLDVIPEPTPVEQFKLVDRYAPPFTAMVDLERSITAAAKMAATWRTTLIPASVTNRGGVGGLELSLTRIKQQGYAYPVDDFRIVSIVRGEGLVRMAGIEQPVKHHDHFGVPAGLTCEIVQTSKAPLVALDAALRGF